MKAAARAVDDSQKPVPPGEGKKTGVEDNIRKDRESRDQLQGFKRAHAAV